jgi:hypothetical protein
MQLRHVGVTVLDSDVGLSAVPGPTRLLMHLSMVSYRGAHDLCAGHATLYFRHMLLC